MTLAYLDQNDGVMQALPVLLIHGFASNIEMNWVATGWVRDLSGPGTVSWRSTTGDMGRARSSICGPLQPLDHG